MNSMELITEANLITPQWLTNRLRQTGHLSSGKVTSIEINQTTRPGVFPLQIIYSSDAPESAPRHLIFKGIEGGMEARFYKEIACQMPDAPVPPCYDLMFDHETERQYMLLKDISDTHYLGILPWWDEKRKQDERHFPHKQDIPTKESTIASFEAIIDEYIKIQAYWWEHPQFQNTELFIHPDYRKTEKELSIFFDQFPEYSKTSRSICEKSITSLQGLFNKRSEDGQALTLVHIDFHIHNIFLPRNPKQHRPIIYDWLEYPYGIGLFALAHLLMTADMPRELRREFEDILLHRYHEGLLKSGIEDYSLENCFYDYRLCVISTLCYPLVKKIPDLLNISIQAFDDWDCRELLQL